MSTLRFRVPGQSQPIGAWLAALLPDVPRRDRRALFERGAVSIEGAPCDRGTADCPPGALVELALGEQAWEDLLPDAAAREAEVASQWQAIVAVCPWSAGRIDEDLAFEVVQRADGLARVAVGGATVSGARVLEGLAALGLPVVGDLVRGGRAAVPEVAGGRGPRVGAPIVGGDLGAIAASLWPWDHDRPGGPPADEAATGAGRLVVSEETARVLASGHAWILQDEASDRADRHRPGALVEVEDRGGRARGYARIEASRAIAARVWAGAGEGQGGASIEARVAQALARRQALLGTPSGETACFRLIHGEGDALPGLHVDRLGPLLRVLVTSHAALDVRARVIDALGSQLPVTPEGLPFSVLEVLHLRTVGRGRLDAVAWRRGGLETLREQGVLIEGAAAGEEAPALRGLERGLAFELDPGWHAPRRPRPGYGLFVDQRENRARLASIATEGGRWLNLFAHTGAFSVALLAAGAEAVTSVDLSGPYLARLERNLARNPGVDPTRHVSFQGDARRALEESGGDLRGIVVDPPTAAAAGRRFWSVREDLEPLLRACLDRLGDGGCLLVTQNRAGPPLGLDRVVERLARRAHREIASIEAAKAGPDHPSLPGFPEGDPFEGVLLSLR